VQFTSADRVAYPEALADVRVDRPRGLRDRRAGRAIR
jgi:hypothetical protein